MQEVKWSIDVFCVILLWLMKLFIDNELEVRSIVFLCSNLVISECYGMLFFVYCRGRDFQRTSIFYRFKCGLCCAIYFQSIVCVLGWGVYCK